MVKVINLDQRSDRMKEAEIELRNFGFSYIERFPAFTGGERGCAMSHYECLKGDGPLFIFEDDIVFETDAMGTLNKAIGQLPDDFDLFYLGANVKMPAAAYSENLFIITGGVHTTHAMLWSDKGRHKMLELWHPESEEFHQIDHWMYMKGQTLMSCFVCYPMIAFQRAAYSDIRGQWIDYRGEMLENQKNNMK